MNRTPALSVVQEQDTCFSSGPCFVCCAGTGIPAKTEVQERTPVLTLLKEQDTCSVCGTRTGHLFCLWIRNRTPVLSVDQEQDTFSGCCAGTRHLVCLFRRNRTPILCVVQEQYTRFVYDTRTQEQDTCFVRGQEQDTCMVCGVGTGMGVRRAGAIISLSLLVKGWMA